MRSPMSQSFCTPRNADFIEVTKRFLMTMPIAQYLGLEITSVGPGGFEITQPYRRDLSFREGTFQAGPIGTIADMAAACASATLLADGWAASTVDYTLKLLAPAVGGKIIAPGRGLQAGRTLSVAAADVFSCFMVRRRFAGPRLPPFETMSRRDRLQNRPNNALLTICRGSATGVARLGLGKTHVPPASFTALSS